MILGAVLAGGGARRFGSDKALVEVEGRTLIAQAVETLAGWCAGVVVTGRDAAPAPCLPDWPQPGMGPLAGLAAALRHARDKGYDAVLSCGVDALGLPADLPALLAPGPACLAQQPVIGLWPVAVAETIESLLCDPAGRHSMMRLAELVGARMVQAPDGLANLNTPEDLAAWLKRRG